jgi:glyceraldehyde-3-phosphate dehydrogenase (NAD(P))
MIRVSDGLVSLNAVEELVSDLGRPRADLWEVALWEDILSIDGTNLYFCQQADNQAIVIPETIDAIRALSGIEHDARASIAKTDNSLGLVKDFAAVPPNLMTHQRRGDINDNR